MHVRLIAGALALELADKAMDDVGSDVPAAPSGPLQRLGGPAAAAAEVVDRHPVQQSMVSEHGDLAVALRLKRCHVGRTDSLGECEVAIPTMLAQHASQMA